MSLFSLRDYQETCIDQAIEAYHNGCRRMLVSSPTGSGKTVTLSHLITKMQKLVQETDPERRQIYLLAHREELCDQLAATAAAVNGHLTVGVERAQEKCYPEHCDIIVASIPTIGKANSKRIEKFDPDKAAVCVTDEAHHAVASTYKRVYDYFGISSKNTNVVHVGFTATAKRHDKVGLKAVFDEIVFHKSVLSMIDDKWLCPMRCLKVDTDTSLDDVKVSHGEFQKKSLADTIDTEDRNKTIVEAWGRYAFERQSTLVFAVNVSHAMSLRDTFREYGIEAETVVGSTPSDERKEALRKFREGKIPVLTNVAVYTEGADIPNIDCILLAKPTKSPLVLMQSIGRGLRLHDDKEDVLILDIVDSLKSGSLMTIPSLLGLDPEFDMKGEDASKTLKKVEEAASQSSLALGAKSVDEAEKVAAKQFDPFNLQDDPSIKQYTKYDWKAAGEEHWAINLGEHGHIEICQNMIDQYEIVWHRSDGKISNSKPVQNLKTAFGKADDMIEHFTSQATINLVNRNARWRNERATEKQINRLQKWKIPHSRDITKDEANRLIEDRLNKWRRKSRDRKNTKRAEVKSEHLEVEVGKIK